MATEKKVTATHKLALKKSGCNIGSIEGVVSVNKGVELDERNGRLGKWPN